MKGKLRHSSLTITVLVAGAALAYVFFFFLPKMRVLEGVRQQIHSKQDYVDRSAKLVASIHQAKKTMEETRSYTDVQKSYCVKQEDLTALFGKLNQIGRKSGVKTTRFEPQAAVAYQTLAKVPILLTVKGQFGSIQSLLYELENLPATIWVEDLKLVAAREDGKATECSLTVGVFTSNSDKSD